MEGPEQFRLTIKVLVEGTTLRAWLSKIHSGTALMNFSNNTLNSYSLFLSFYYKSLLHSDLLPREYSSL